MMAAQAQTSGTVASTWTVVVKRAVEKHSDVTLNGMPMGVLWSERPD